MQIEACCYQAFSSNPIAMVHASFNNIYIISLNVDSRQCVGFGEGINACKPKFSLTCHPQQRCHTHYSAVLMCLAAALFPCMLSKLTVCAVLTMC